MKLRTVFAIPLALAPLALAACSDGGTTGTQANGTVAIRFGVTGARATQLADGPRLATTGAPLVVTGANGTLSITSVQLVIARIKLKGNNAAACGTQTSRSGENEPGECEFEAGPALVDLPLTGTQLTVSTGAVPPGTYSTVRFKVKNLDFRDDDDHEDDDSGSQQAVAALFNNIRGQYPDWPAKASMRVTGTFTPTGGAARDFTAYLNAEAKVQLLITPPLEVAEGSNTATVSVTLDPTLFFRAGTNVVDLSQFTASHVGEFEVESEHGFESEGRHGRD